MAITFFGVASSPADNSGQTGATVTIAPPASMQDGDLVLVSVRRRSSTGTWSNTTTGGQAWFELDQYNTTNIRARWFWCRFNGTWAADPVFTITGTSAVDGQMLVFRPTSAAHTWSLDAAQAADTYAAPSSPFTVTVTGRTTVAASTVTVAAWHSVDNNTWGTLSGAGWSKTSLAAQYRNTNNSTTYAYYIATSAATSIPNVSQNQASLGGDAGSRSLLTFAETLVTAAITGVAATVAAGSLGISLPHVGLEGLESATAIGSVTVDAGGASDSDTAEPGAVVANVSVGTTLVHVGAAPGGVAATATAGSLASAITTAGVASVSATADVGTVQVEGGVSNASPEAEGVEATAQVGTLAALTPGTVVPTGVGIGAAVGTLLLHPSHVPVGASATASAGTAVGTGSQPGEVPLGGVVSAAEAGLLSSAITVAGVAGVEAAAEAGTPTASGAGVVLGTGQPAGRFATAQVGSLAIFPSIAIQGVSAVATAEEIGSSVLSAEIDGVSATATAGAIAPSVSVPLFGASSTASAGSLSVFGQAAPTLVSVQSVAAVGTLAGLSDETGGAVAEGVESAAEVGTAQADWTALFDLEGVEIVSSVNDVGVQAGDNEPAEVFPAGVSATAQVGVLSTGEARAAPGGVESSARAGSFSVSVVIPYPLDRPDSISVVPMFEATVSVEPQLTADLVRVIPVT